MAVTRFGDKKKENKKIVDEGNRGKERGEDSQNFLLFAKREIIHQVKMRYD